MSPLIQRKEDTGEDKCNHNGVVTHKDKNPSEEKRNKSSLSKGNVAMNQINIDAVVEPVLKIQIEPPSNTSEKNENSEIKTKVYLEFQAGGKYPQSDSDSQSSGSTHKALEASNNIVQTEKELGVKVTFQPPQETKSKEAVTIKERFKLRRSSSCG